MPLIACPGAAPGGKQRSGAPAGPSRKGTPDGSASDGQGTITYRVTLPAPTGAAVVRAVHGTCGRAG
ncbi:hypothetical protein GCM10010121_066510 [Streptomyces brasiliensis]|uniref:Uncharacterized protein n=1 Tax=Streptomyces brasiliensis TaxID=1954 RepID=A0A917L6N8_9ACTN|nr:hypothetical protein GCM10010121_066510 [Streptomyces brasiliensis]